MDADVEVITYRCPKLGCTEPHTTHPRPDAYHRGYTSARWRKLRTAFLKAHPLCSGTHSQCEKLGRYTKATLVDHDTPVTGADDPRFFTGPFNALCAQCHQAKTNRESQRHD